MFNAQAPVPRGLFLFPREGNQLVSSMIRTFSRHGLPADKCLNHIQLCLGIIHPRKPWAVGSTRQKQLNAVENECLKPRKTPHQAFQHKTCFNRANYQRGKEPMRYYYARVYSACNDKAIFNSRGDMDNRDRAGAEVRECFAGHRPLLGVPGIRGAALRENRSAQFGNALGCV